MRILAVVLTLTGLVCGDKLDRGYLPPNHAQTSGGDAEILDTPNGSHQDLRQGPNSYNNFAENLANPGAEITSGERSAAILKLDSENDGESYSYSYETENGIYGEEHGVAINGVQAQGGYRYTGDDGQVYEVRYVADENGFQPQGAHLPTPPPVPEEILKALEQNAADEARGIFDDGSYDHGKYGGGNSNGYGNQAAEYVNAPTGNNPTAQYRQQPSELNVGNTYLPPKSSFGQSASPSQYRQQNAELIGAKSYLPPKSSFGQPRPAKYQEETLELNAAKAYLPPKSSNQPAKYRQEQNPELNGAKSYLPPKSSFGQKANLKTYLPPQKATSRGFEKRPSFNSRTGYNY